jgi:hypothetical protein
MLLLLFAYVISWVHLPRTRQTFRPIYPLYIPLAAFCHTDLPDASTLSRWWWRVAMEGGGAITHDVLGHPIAPPLPPEYETTDEELELLLSSGSYLEIESAPLTTDR